MNLINLLINEVDKGLKYSTQNYQTESRPYPADKIEQDPLNELERNHSAEFYCAVPSSGLDPQHGRQFVSQDFKITPDKISGQVNNTPKFEFFGKIGSINCAFTEPFDGYMICKDSEL